MALHKQAKIINDRQVRAVLAELDTRRYPLRDRVMFLLSIKAGLRAVEISRCTWAMVTNSESQIGDVIALQNRASKGNAGGRIIPMHPDLKAALVTLHRERGVRAHPDWPVMHSERDHGLSAGAVAGWFPPPYTRLGVTRCSSHNRARAFVTPATRPGRRGWGGFRVFPILGGPAKPTTPPPHNS